MSDKPINIWEGSSKSNQFFNGKSEIISIVKLKYHQKQFKIPTKFSISNKIFFFTIVKHVAHQSWNISNGSYSLGDLAISFVLILAQLTNQIILIVLDFILLFFKFLFLKSFYC